MNTVRISAIEVVQSIQNLENSVVVIAGKPTYVRVYLEHTNPAIRTHARGKLTVEHPDRQPIEVDSDGTVELLGVEHPSVESQRLQWSQSLNFKLPVDSLHGTVTLSLNSLTDLHDRTSLAFDYGPALLKNSVEVTFADSPVMRCRAVAVRYMDPETNEPNEPTPEQLDLIRSFVSSAFPVRRIEWSAVTVEAASAFQRVVDVQRPATEREVQINLALSTLFRQILALRNQDLCGGDEDLATLYLGVLSDPSGDFGGAAMDSPDHPAPHTVAVASVDASGELGAHELAHALGRKHPGYPRLDRHGPEIGQQTEDPYYPYELGFISQQRNGHSAHVGLDSRVPGNEPQVLHYSRWFDLMTYRRPKWLSAYTYEGVYNRLRDQQRQDFRVANPDRSWTIIGQYDLDRITGRVWYVLPTRYRTPNPVEGKTERFPIRIRCDSGAGERETFPVYVRSPNVRDLQPQSGIFQFTLECDEPPACVWLLIGDREVDCYCRDQDSQSAVFAKIEQVAADVTGRPSGTIAARAVRPAAFRPLRGEEGGQPAPEPWQQSLPTEEGVELYYDISADSYFLCFRWPVPDSAIQRVTTTVQCRRPALAMVGSSKQPPDRGPWETVAITNSRAENIWISAEFLGRPNPVGAKAHPRSNDSISDRAGDALSYRILITAGFETREVLCQVISPIILSPSPWAEPSPGDARYSGV